MLDDEMMEWEAKKTSFGMFLADRSWAELVQLGEMLKARIEYELSDNKVKVVDERKKFEELVKEVVADLSYPKDVDMADGDGCC